MNPTDIPSTVTDLIIWTHNPDANSLRKVLDALSLTDLHFALTHLRTEPAGRIAWAEYGRRLGFVDFEVRAVVMDGKLTVTFEGDAKAVHHGAAFKLNQ